MKLKRDTWESVLVSWRVHSLLFHLFFIYYYFSCFIFYHYYNIIHLLIFLVFLLPLGYTPYLLYLFIALLIVINRYLLLRIVNVMLCVTFGCLTEQFPFRHKWSIYVNMSFKMKRTMSDSKFKESFLLSLQSTITWAWTEVGNWGPGSS